jgi:hypothetical protein
VVPESNYRDEIKRIQEQIDPLKSDPKNKKEIERLVKL